MYDPAAPPWCAHWDGSERRYCGAPSTRLYLIGHRFPLHTPAALAGRPEAPGSPMPLRRRTVEPRRDGLGMGPRHRPRYRSNGAPRHR
ncbi:hypothetical protein E2651_06140 [Streptomyces sp. MZ04]|nr:hypothetical protein E2651_06140 [Streptomyces sp. MZ04]